VQGVEKGLSGTYERRRTNVSAPCIQAHLWLPCTAASGLSSAGLDPTIAMCLRDRHCSFEDAHVAITGGGSGIGLELARQFLQQGAAGVSLLDISDCAAALSDLGAERSRHPGAQGRLVSCRADVTDFQQA